MKTKHTPGPWVCLPEEADKDYIRVRGTYLGGRYKVANVPTPTYEGVHEREVQQTRCNAHLIAASPDSHGCNVELAAIVRELCAAYGHPLPSASLERSDAAIAKATGRTG